MIIAIDFDGTLCEHKYPEIGNEVPLAFDTLKALQAKGHQLMLWTMRGNDEKKSTLREALEWCAARGILFWGVNKNPDQEKEGWTNSNKQYANLYIDDAALGCPLLMPEGHTRPFVDWKSVWEFLVITELI